jgi:predicted nucleic acid-binding protein
MTNDRAYVFDAFALIAHLQNEPGGPRVRELLETGERGEAGLSLTSVNLGEVIYSMRLRRGELAAAEALSKIEEWPVSVIDANRSLALAAAQIKAERRMGYLDCFVVALAQRLGATILTGDPDFRRAEGLTNVEWLAIA